MADDKQKYLEYLDKEMTIMGILSTFAVLIVSLLLQQIGSAEEHKLFNSIWKEEGWYILVGSASTLIAAMLFYLQRADLAWHYGRLARAEDGAEDSASKADFLKEADSWATWIPYIWGFKFLYIGFLTFYWAFVEKQSGVKLAWWITTGAVVVILGLIGLFQTWLHREFCDEEKPWRAFLKRIHPSPKPWVNFQLDPAALRQLKMLAVEKGKPMQALLCDGLNKIFTENNRPPIAK